MLRLACDKCGREGRYSVLLLIEKHGRDGKLTDWLSTITSDCSKKRSVDMSDHCAARCPDLAQVP